MGEARPLFVQVENKFYPIESVQFEVEPYSGYVTVYRLGGYEVVGIVGGKQAEILIGSLNRNSVVLVDHR